jgi:hypothetical protein
MIFRRKAQSLSVFPEVMQRSQFVHVSISLPGIRKMHDKMKGRGNYHVIRYENLAMDPLKTPNDWCQFLNIKFNPEMSNPQGFQNASLKERKKAKKGIDRTSVYAGQEKLPKIISSLIGKMNENFMISFEYS